MRWFVDTGSVEEVRRAVATGYCDGVTTNPSLISKHDSRPLKEIVMDIVGMVPGPTSVEVIAQDTDGMIAEGEMYSTWSPHVVVKVPCTPDGLRACKALRKKNIPVNVTLCFQPVQALAAAKCDATYISPFIGRLDDIGHIGADLISDIRAIYDTYGYKTQILAASIRSVEHITRVALLGADIATMPMEIFDKLIKHPLTDIGLAKFLGDWKSKRG